MMKTRGDGPSARHPNAQPAALYLNKTVNHSGDPLESDMTYRVMSIDRELLHPLAAITKPGLVNGDEALDAMSGTKSQAVSSQADEIQTLLLLH